ncbi:hypothetical protein ASPZODRAFT_137226 [Penicilliopsis zonata CBS 506.65]|uniref:Ketoreductase (KR) domain-containing protein n=1 Tax=Penicilliopsis zonata CBS 506.65 TaxID=1073090 RepID=A0A1L9S617_9EURO|nr:hypothetical protein ASPZODRAFT_137226 [Penicilliopsis zonata CBS 506.65]OJJ42618.1 hypothetical protein ASPZODRAFT_137226 [Penicilliopsis zonata CBS 506.65]
MADRAALTLRQIPRMALSTASNRLTAPLSPDTTAQTPAERAAARFRVEGNAVVTGGAGALGLTVVRALLEHGATAATLFDLRETFDSSAGPIARLRADFPERRIYTRPVDVTDTELVEKAMETAAKTMGSVDILCCLAGVVGCVDSLAVSTEAFTKVLDVNLTGSFCCAQAAARQMVAQGTGGSIVLTASISAHHTNFPQPQVAYNVSKAGVAHMARNLAAEWAVHGIRVNSVSPGYMDTVLNAGDSLQPVREIWAAHCPMGRMGDVEEITGAFILLASRRAGRYITGADLLVDGGAMAL